MFHLFIIKNIRLPTFLSFLYSTSSPKQTCLAADCMIQIHVLAIFSEILVSIYLSLRWDESDNYYTDTLLTHNSLSCSSIRTDTATRSLLHTLELQNILWLKTRPQNCSGVGCEVIPTP